MPGPLAHGSIWGMVQAPYCGKVLHLAVVLLFPSPAFRDGAKPFPSPAQGGDVSLMCETIWPLGPAPQHLSQTTESGHS